MSSKLTLSQAVKLATLTADKPSYVVIDRGEIRTFHEELIYGRYLADTLVPEAIACDIRQLASAVADSDDVAFTLHGPELLVSGGGATTRIKPEDQCCLPKHPIIWERQAVGVIEVERLLALCRVAFAAGLRPNPYRHVMFSAENGQLVTSATQGAHAAIATESVDWTRQENTKIFLRRGAVERLAKVLAGKVTKYPCVNVVIGSLDGNRRALEIDIGPVVLVLEESVHEHEKAVDIREVVRPRKPKVTACIARRELLAVVKRAMVVARRGRSRSNRTLPADFEFSPSALTVTVGDSFREQIAAEVTGTLQIRFDLALLVKFLAAVARSKQVEADLIDDRSVAVIRANWLKYYLMPMDRNRW